ncbi:MAG TPA: hypothetical protein VIL42_06980 [Sphingomicrobium sp.]|jgi:hypothetical protein
MASIPSKTLMGVERVVIACTPDGSLSASEAQAICGQLVKKAQAVTSLPVGPASAADLEPAAMALPNETLLLRVALSASPRGDGYRKLSLAVTPARSIKDMKASAPIKSEAQITRVQDKLVVQGPVNAFSRILGAVPAKLHKPIRSDL